MVLLGHFNGDAVLQSPKKTNGTIDTIVANRVNVVNFEKMGENGDIIDCHWSPILVTFSGEGVMKSARN